MILAKLNSAGISMTSGTTTRLITRGLIGRVKYFDTKLGWGFINGRTDEDRRGVFVYHTDIVQEKGFKYLDAGELVSYEISVDEKGKKKAINVKDDQGKPFKRLDL